jgi:signal transduction histidine kinase
VPLISLHDGEIRQLIANLVSNAIDAMPRGGRVIVRTAYVQDMKTGRTGARLTVADDGIGMDQQTQKRIFEPFFSTKGTTGTGLGLWVSLEVVTKQSGRLHVRSRQSTPYRRGGTVITAFLPSTDSLIRPTS